MAEKFVAITAMIAEINLCSSCLVFPVEQPVALENLGTKFVSDPWIAGFGGTLETKDYSFIFHKSGILRRIQPIHPFEQIPLRQLQWRQSRMTSLINTNKAYQITTNWLLAISVDLLSLENKFPPSVDQRFFYPDSNSLDDPPDKRKRIILLPIYHVYWGDKENPAVLVSIFGPTKEMLGIFQNDYSFSRRPRDLLRDISNLLAIDDGEFSQYFSEQRNDLIGRFTSICFETNFLLKSKQDVLQHNQTNTATSNP